MAAAPRISIVTSSYNQAQFIGRTIESVLAQDYPWVEHIVVDGMSTDRTGDVLAAFPHLTVMREPDRGQADAINKGFRVATDPWLPQFGRHARARSPPVGRGRHRPGGRAAHRHGSLPVHR
jgi:cellulose synthase/poly-beta-1,6-N-acetylglucosamine synthase-like glycosyltransferase